jgi:hypothetical protein
MASTGFEAQCASTATPQGAIDGILNCFYLMQGMGNVLALQQTAIRDSWIAPMLQDPLQATPSQPLLQELIQHVPDLVTFMQGKRDLPEPEKQLYLGTRTPDVLTSPCRQQRITLSVLLASAIES